jgi:hypothetical protein
MRVAAGIALDSILPATSEIGARGGCVASHGDFCYVPLTMFRQPLVDGPAAFHHVMVRGEVSVFCGTLANYFAGLLRDVGKLCNLCYSLAQRKWGTSMKL